MSALAGLALVALPFVLSPGASFTLVLAHTLAGQRGAAARIAAGTALGIIVLAAAVAISGLGPALEEHPTARTVLVLAGGAVLATIAARTITAGVRALRHPTDATTTGEPAALVRWSFLVLVTNAKALTLYAVVVPTLTSGQLHGAPLYLTFAAVHVDLMAAWLAGVAWAARHLPAARSPRVRAIIMVATGAALAAVALTTALSGLR